MVDGGGGGFCLFTLRLAPPSSLMLQQKPPLNTWICEAVGALDARIEYVRCMAIEAQPLCLEVLELGLRSSA